VYQALRHLKKEEVIIEIQREVSLSSIWLNRLGDFTQQTLRHYKMNDQPSINFMRLGEGEKISYSFRTFEKTDIFWGHAFQVLADNMPSSVPMLSYTPHDWFFLARPESEIFLFNKLRERNKRIYLIAGGRTELDLETARFFDNEYSFYYASPKSLFKRENYYLSVFNDYLIEVWFDPGVSRMIDDLYREACGFDATIKSRLLDIITHDGKNKFVISKNTRKIHATRKLFMKTFGLVDKDFGL
jgi:hypothetical protein